jgi:hypothetical protein
MLLPAGDRALEALAKPCVHAHEPIARPFTNLLVAGLCGAFFILLFKSDLRPRRPSAMARPR